MERKIFWISFTVSGSLPISFCRSGGPWARPFPSCTSRGGWLTAAAGSS